MKSSLSMQRAALVFSLTLLSLASCGDDDDSNGSHANGGVGGDAIAFGGSTSLAGSPNESGGSPGSGGSAGASGGSTQLPDTGGAAGAGGEGSRTQHNVLCPPARTNHPIPARAALYGGASDSFSNVVLVQQIVERFDGYCAGCHRAPNSQGNFSYTADSFGSVVDQRAIDRMRTPDDSLRMPPLSPPLTGGPLGELAYLLELWIQQGRPSVSIKLPSVSTSAPSDSVYAIDETIGKNLTNLGHCIPVAAAVGTKSDDLDARFAAMQSFEELPKKLSQTDLFTLDTEELAQHNTVAFAPNYQLWSFDAGKLRHIHVPRGEHVQYQKSTPNYFRIPENTRFYKTFLKPVVDKNGNTGWRKMETRLIVARKAQRVDGKKVERALFATYVWNASETEATLLEKPYFNNSKFKDQIQTYVADERLFKATLESSNQSGPVVLRQLDGTKEYPVPGAHRCVQCHMGAESDDFVLGFTPYQIDRRQLAEGGTYEAPGEDELTQVERLIAYGVVAGVKNAISLPKLEDSGVGRQPRNQYELRAQAYLYGNCSHCHNPDGYPTVLNPGLEPLNFRPGGVVFQFPLDLASPLRIRASNGLAYINPDLSFRQADDEHIPRANPLPLAPWDSLIYRNTQAPATYDEDGIIYPHMPMHVAGIDCRAQLFLGTWNASIPYQFKSSQDHSKLDSALPEAIASADDRVRTFLTQMPGCKPADDLRDWGARGADFTDLSSPWGIPDRPHFFEEDFTETYGDFQPRGANFRTAMLLPKYQLIRDFQASQELIDFVRSDFPLDFWANKPTCDFSQAPDYSGPVEQWMGNLAPDKAKRVYSTLPGAAAFEAICSNCHGSRGDAQSNLAASIATLTGGQTRVANYAQGLFGPLSNPTANLAFFDREPLADGTLLGPPDGAAKYMMWMALGGTQALIPAAALRQVAAAPVASQTRKNAAGFASANMLQIAVEICANTIQYNTDLWEPVRGVKYNVSTGDPDVIPDAQKLLVATMNGEYPLYKRLCSIDNLRPVRVVDFSDSQIEVSGYIERSVFRDAGLPWSGSDDAPYCFDPESFEDEVPPGTVRCPQKPSTHTVAAQWAQRGALNVGYAVYDYLKRAFQDPSEWRPRYNECELRYPAK
ncbi:MAG: hypothetical protein ACOY0T_20770 [Myxococcota bacterium]